MRLAANNSLADILVVDDTLSDRQFLSEILVEQGYRVVTAGSGSQALEEINLAIPDLVLLDINMPDMDGFEVCRQLKQSVHFAGIPVIFISSYDDIDSKVAAFNCGGIDYVTKPFMVAEVKARIRAHLEMKRVRDRLGFQAGHDPLTGLPNRSLLVDRLQQALNYAERYDSQVAVAYLDLDKFKEVNDRFGHQAGDRLLVEVSRRLLTCVRESDTVARLGGDEFAIVFYDQSDENVTVKAMQRILECIAEPLVVDDFSLNMSCSIGFTSCPQDGRDVDTLLKNADTAMYRAKELGRNNIQFYTSELNSRVNERMILEKSLRQALQRDEFVLHYQPRIELRGGRVIGLEALLRWRHPERGLLPPLSFIPIAEQAGLIGQVGDWVLRTVCRQQSVWQQKGVQQVPVSINISAAQFLSPGFAQSIADVLQETNINASLLELEFKETLLMSDPATSIRVLRELRDIGIGLSIDDFGTGFSNLGYLKQFAVDRLKLDPSFVSGIESQPDDLALADAVIGIAHSLHLKVAAEGIEKGSQLALLADHGCDEMQGDYFSPAVPVDVCTALMLDKRVLSMDLLLRCRSRRTLLLVDDDSGTRVTMANIAKLAGYCLLEAADAQAAFAILAQQDVGVIVYEQYAPGMSGVEFFNRIRCMYPKSVRIMLSRFADPSVAADAINHGAVFKFVQKPWKPAAMTVILDAAFAQYEGEARLEQSA